jgi:hypothetical protein
MDKKKLRCGVLCVISIRALRTDVEIIGIGLVVAL